MDFDFVDNIGEGAFYSDEENAQQNRDGDDPHPSDVFQRDIEDFISFDEEGF